MSRKETVVRVIVEGAQPQESETALTALLKAALYNNGAMKVVMEALTNDEVIKLASCTHGSMYRRLYPPYKMR